MLYFDRDAMAYPDFLDSSMVEKGRGIIATYIENMMSKGGQRRAPNLQKLLSEPALVEALYGGFQGVCAFCETPSEKPDAAWVGHFRPMQLAEDISGSTSLLYYIWLALEWENLLHICPDCARAKANKFYTQEPRGNYQDSVAQLRQTEQELLIDPTWPDLSGRIQFFATGVVNGADYKGRTTIELLDLNRPKLISARKAAIKDGVAMLMEGHLEAAPGRNGAEPHLLRPRTPSSPALPYQGVVSNVLVNWALNNTQTEGLEDFVQLVSELDADTKQEMSDEILLPPLSEPQIESSVGMGFEAAKPETKPPGRPRKPSRNLRLDTMPLADAQIQSVHIENFKALREISFTLPDSVPPPKNSSVTQQAPCMLVLGENATGKSSVLEALTLCLLGTSEMTELNDLLKDEDLSPEKMIHRPDTTDWDRLSEEPLRVEIGYLDRTEGSSLSGLAAAPTFFGSPKTSKILMSYGPRRYFRPGKSYRRRAPAYRVQSQFDPLTTIADPAAWLLDCKPAQFDAAARALRVVLMLTEDQYFEREPTPDGKGRIVIDTPGGRTPLSEMSVGYKSIVAMATDIIRELFYYYDNTEFAHAVVLIDEIETHLHPRWKMQIVALLREAFPMVQFIITTHDPLCLRGMNNGEVFVLQRSPEDARVETLTDLPNVEGMRAEQLLTSEFFGLSTTDPEGDLAVEDFHRLSLKEDRTPEEDGRLNEVNDFLKKRLGVGDTANEQLAAMAARNHPVQIEPVLQRLPEGDVRNELMRISDKYRQRRR
ncbi:AAA family ATPase [Algirhabdus cladophorae]|uniref:AAA family ATPase n=1 Tax=Algirhabdus cladophorae TaxID=3377108 RepID=UPI003B84B17E